MEREQLSNTAKIPASDIGIGRATDQLFEAAACGDVNGIISALKDGADPKFSTPTLQETALMIAARQDHPECVRLLLPVSEIKKENIYGEDALLMAQKYGENGCSNIIAEYVLAQNSKRLKL